MKKLILICTVTLFLTVGSAIAGSLTVIGTATYEGASRNLIYDADSPFGPITWLDYTSWGGIGGAGDWQSSVDWAASLNGSGVITYNLNSGVEMNWV